MKLARHATMWIAEGDFELAGDRCAHVWEPLQINVPLNARPHPCYGNVVVFYDEKHQELGRCVHFELAGTSPHLVHIGGRWWEVGTGAVVTRNGRWCVKWHLCSNTTRAREANAGRDAERMLAVSVSN